MVRAMVKATFLLVALAAFTTGVSSQPMTQDARKLVLMALMDYTIATNVFRQVLEVEQDAQTLCRAGNVVVDAGVGLLNAQANYFSSGQADALEINSFDGQAFSLAIDVLKDDVQSGC